MIIPYVLETSDSGYGERSVDIYTRLLKDRIVYLGHPINDEVANVIIAQLLYLRMDNPKKPIKIYINSSGGYLNSALAILDTMQLLGCDVITYCIGQAVAASVLILAGGTQGERYGLPHCRVMLHQPGGEVGGTAADMILQAKEVRRLKDLYISLLAQFTKKSVKEVSANIEREYWMTPEDSESYGIIDKVMTPVEKLEEDKAPSV